MHLSLDKVMQNLTYASMCILSDMLWLRYMYYHVQWNFSEKTTSQGGLKWKVVPYEGLNESDEITESIKLRAVLSFIAIFPGLYGGVPMYLWSLYIQSHNVITQSNLTWYYLQCYCNSGRKWIRFGNHNRHPISRPHGWAMGCLLWGLGRKLATF